MRFFIFYFVSISRILLTPCGIMTVIYLVPRLLSGSSGTLEFPQARPCIEVRILPFHPNISAGLFPKELFSFRLRRHCSHLSHCCGRALPATLSRVTSSPMFGLSSPILPTASGCKIECPEGIPRRALHYIQDAQFFSYLR